GPRGEHDRLEEPGRDDRPRRGGPEGRDRADEGAGRERRMSAKSGRGLLVVLSGPSGVGKTSVAERLLAQPGFARAVTATPRAPRKGERDGVDYVFLDEPTFRARVARGDFLEHAEVHGKLYGTPRESVDGVLRRGLACLLVIDVQGAAALRKAGVEALYVFV